VSHVVRGSPSRLQAGKTARRSTLFGEMGVPIRVPKPRGVRVVEFESTWDQITVGPVFSVEPEMNGTRMSRYGC
jgi:hypothetical protein